MRRDLIRRAAESVLPPLEIDRPKTTSLVVRKKGSARRGPESQTTVVAFPYDNGHRIMCVGDRKVSVGYGIMSEEFRKIAQVSMNSLLLSCGSVGSSQEMEARLRSRCESFLKSHGIPISIHGQARLLSRWCNWYRAVDYEFSFGGIVAGSNHDGGMHIFAVDDGGSYIEMQRHYADGSGGAGATIYLDDAWKPDMNFEEALRVGITAIYRAAKRDSGSSPLSVAVPNVAIALEGGGVMFVPEELVRGVSFQLLMDKMKAEGSISPFSILNQRSEPRRRKKRRKK